MRDEKALPFPIAYQALALNGAKGGATKYASLQFLNYARWTAQAESCGVLRALRLIVERHGAKLGRMNLSNCIAQV